MKLLALIMVAPCLLFCIGCGESTLKPSEYVRWAENPDNGLRSKHEAGQIAYTLQYKPAEYIVALEEKTDNLNPNVLKHRKQELGDLQYFNLRLEPIDKSTDVVTLNLASEAAYTERVNYFSFGMKGDVKLLAGADTMHCELFQFVQNYGIGPYADFVLGFDPSGIAPESHNEDLTLLLADRVYGNGTIEFNVETAALADLPELTTN